MAAEQEPVEQGPQRLVLGQVVRGREQREQREPVDLGPPAVDPLVEDRQQVVEDRAVGVEQLVEEGELGLGEHPGGDRGDGPLAEPGQVDRAEDLVGLGEAGQQVFEVPPLDRRGELADQGRLRRPRRPVEEQVLAGDDRQGDQVDDLVAADEPALQVVDHVGAEPLDRRRQPRATPSAIRPAGRAGALPRPSKTSSTYSSAGPRGIQPGFSVAGQPLGVEHPAGPGGRRGRRRRRAPRRRPTGRPRAARRGGPRPGAPPAGRPGRSTGPAGGPAGRNRNVRSAERCSTAVRGGAAGSQRPLHLLDRLGPADQEPARLPDQLRRRQRRGRASNAIGGPATSSRWSANAASRTRQRLRAGRPPTAPAGPGARPAPRRTAPGGIRPAMP